MSDTHDGLQQIIDEALESMAEEGLADFDPQKCNLAEFCRRTGLSGQRSRTIKRNGFKIKPNGNAGSKRKTTVLSSYTDHVDNLLRKGITNSQVVFERLTARGYEGRHTTVKRISENTNTLSLKKAGSCAARKKSSEVYQCTR